MLHCEHLKIYMWNVARGPPFQTCKYATDAIRLSVCPSATLVNCVHIVWKMESKLHVRLSTHVHYFELKRRPPTPTLTLSNLRSKMGAEWKTENGIFHLQMALSRQQFKLRCSNAAGMFPVTDQSLSVNNFFGEQGNVGVVRDSPQIFWIIIVPQQHEIFPAHSFIHSFL